MKYKLAHHYAHRGFHDKPAIPENSMAAFSRAAEHGFPVEFDVHLLSDGGLAVFHDEDLERETGVKGRMKRLDLSSATVSKEPMKRSRHSMKCSICSKIPDCRSS